MAVKGKVDTATLIRGRTYTYKSVKYERGVPRIIDDADLLEDLETQYDEVSDDEGEVYEKPRFRIDRNVDAPESEQRRNRLSATREVKEVRRPIRRRG